ncbi:hypothetical protein HZH68_016244 [Vespula germanica]|uniref:Uncharacterized protein n=1 Tax=Vespula germanica TaxID=30212 RepID=A0A834J232_VESGE|nr:hypothetical protein HZH68_016244 [Vespula germanica]
MTTNLLETHIVQIHEATFEWWYGARENIPSKDTKEVIYTVTIFISLPWVKLATIKKILGAIKNDSKKEDLRINLEEEEEEREDTGYEDIQGECKDYSSTFAHDLFDDRFYLDDDDSTDKFNSSQNNVSFLSILDCSSARLDGPVQMDGNEWLGPVNVTFVSDFDNMTGIFHLSFPYQTNNRIRQLDETIV